jgi:predicted NBD/HSP70 family sugar kinase
LTRVAGIDVGGTTTKAVVVDQDGQLVSQLEITTRTATDAVREALDLLGDPVDRVGVAVPGTVDSARGTVRDAVNLGIVEELDVRALVEQRRGVPCQVENDTTAAAVGAARLLDRRDLAVLCVGTGLAAGLVLGGSPWRGRHGGAGELGHLPLGRAGVRCPCGDDRCLEAVASGGAVARRTGLRISDLAQQAPDVLSDVARHLTRAVELLLLVVDVDVALAGGGAVPELWTLVRQEPEARAASSRYRRALGLAERVVLAPAGVPLGALGAALLARHD